MFTLPVLGKHPKALKQTVMAGFGQQALARSKKAVEGAAKWVSYLWM